MTSDVVDVVDVDVVPDNIHTFSAEDPALI